MTVLLSHPLSITVQKEFPMIL